MNKKSSDSSSPAPQKPENTAAANSANKTPMFSAIHASRYHRQGLIKDIQLKYGRRTVSYISGSAASINRDDIVFFVDLLHNIVPNSDLDLILHTGGGDVDAAEKLISLVRTRVGTGRMRVIVPDFAKSAGTLMTLGADRIVMSDTSELGPIDPQITLNDGHGNLIRHSVQSYLDAYEFHADALQKNPNDAVASIMLGKLEPATVKLFEAVRDRARKFAEDQLKLGMFRSGTGNFTKIASDLIDTKRWLTHGQMIGWQDAIKIGLSVDYLDPSSEEWQCYWQLYCLQRLAIQDRQKLFEADVASLTVESTV
jgi:ATP-dependent protease ClpP protease subunit